MAVNKPQNVDDEDCVDGEEIVGRAMNEPTSMSYSLERIRFAEIFRTSLERAQFAALSPDTISFQLVQELETQISRFWDDAPRFLCFNPDLSIIDMSASKITIQGYILNLFVHGQRCRVHLPYLARGQAGLAYATSRAACVESARLIIRMEMRLEEEEHDFASTRLRMSIVLHHIFLAFLVLLLDICLDTNGPRQISKSPEAAVAWRILQDAKAQSQQASTLVEPLGRVMRKHDVLHNAEEPENWAFADLGAHGSASALAPSLEFNPPTSWGSVRESTRMPQGGDNTGISQEISTSDWPNFLGGLYLPFI